MEYVIKHFRRSVIISSVLIVGSFVVAGGAQAWLSGLIQSEAVEIANTKDVIRTRSATRGVLANLKVLAPQAEEYQIRLDGYIPPRDHLLSFRNWIENFAAFYDVGLSFDFRGEEVPPQEGVAGLAGIVLNLEGEYEDILNFIDQLEGNPQQFLVGFDQIDAVRVGEDRYRILVGGSIYFR